MNTARTFIAIDIPPGIKKLIELQTAGLSRQVGGAVRWVAQENVHLTLKFLGDLPTRHIDALSQAMAVECGSQSEFELSIRGAGCFPNIHRPRVIWIGIDRSSALFALQRRLELIASRFIDTTEPRPFSAHLTLGRVRDQISPVEMQRLKDALAEFKIGQLGVFTPQHVILYKSELKSGGSHYTPIFSAQLGHSGPVIRSKEKE